MAMAQNMEEIQESNHIHDEAEDNYNDWSEEEVREVINKVIHVSGNKSFHFEVKKLNWDELRMEGREPETCKSMFLKLTHNIRKHRTMSEILNDATESLTKSLTKVNTNFSKPLTGYFMYIQEKESRLKEKHPDMPRKERLAKLLKRWNKSEVLRSQYQEKYKVLYDEYKSKLGKLEDKKPKEKEPKRGPKIPTPFKMFCLKKKASELEKNPEMDWNHITALLKSKYSKLSDKKKFRFMNKALEQMSEYKKKVEAYKQNHPDFEAKSDELPLSKEEKNILNDKFPKPLPVPLNVYQYYCSKERPKLSGVNVADHSRQLAASYNELKDDAKLVYEAEFKESVEEHIEKLQKYREQIAPWSDKTVQEATAQIEKYQRALEPKRKKRKGGRAKTAVEIDTSSVPGTDKAQQSQKRKAREASDDESTPVKRKKRPSEEGTPKGGLSKSLFGASFLKSKSRSSSSEAEESCSDQSNTMHLFSKISPLKSPKKES